MKRQKLVQVHLNIFEHDALKRAADDYGLPLTTYVRLMALRQAKELLEIREIDFCVNAIDISITDDEANKK